MERPLEPGSSWLGFSGYERRPVKDLYAAFRRPRHDADRSTGELAARIGALDFGYEVAEAEGRLLLAGLGVELGQVYALPAGDDRIAMAVLPNGGGGLGVPGPDGLLMLCNQTETGALVFHGMVADAVESVDLIVAGVTHEARMGENAFGLRLDRAHEADQERIVLHRRDGTTGGIALRPED